MPGRATNRSRKLGQHFLGSEQFARRLVADADIGGEDRVVDLGAGTGVLTAPLATRAASVLAVEIDPALVAGLAHWFEAIPNVVRPVPSVDAAVLEITRRESPEVPTGEFAAYAAFVRSRWPDRPAYPSLHSRAESANMI